MTSHFLNCIRLCVVLACLVGMPVLAMPSVAEWCEARIYSVPQRRQIIFADEPVQPASVAMLDTVALWDFPTQLASFEQPVAESVPEAEPDLDALAAEVRQLGATFYRLELVEQSPQLYRFTAQFEEPGDLPRRWQQSATHTDPALAIRQVIDDIYARRHTLKP
jgi:hypothetical protein